MISVVVPAYNESAVIDRCLRAMLADARPGEFEVIVVANNCSDDTADKARAHGEMVTVIETPIGSKINALNLGDDRATGFPRMYVDADIVVTTEALRDVAAMLGEGSEIVVAAPTAVVDYAQRPRLVRSFYRVWTSLPYFTEGVIGAGFYAFSREGRSRFEQWPDIIADDEYARLMAAPGERAVTPHHTFTITPPTNLRAVAKIFTRARAGMYQLHQRFPELLRNETTNASRTVREIAVRPELWLHAPIYLGLMSYARMMANRKLRLGQQKVWERDETARVATS